MYALSNVFIHAEYFKNATSVRDTVFPFVLTEYLNYEHYVQNLDYNSCKERWMWQRNCPHCFVLLAVVYCTSSESE